MKYIDFSWNLIAGLMLGAEYVEDEDDKFIVLDLFIVRVMIFWGDL
jgi:hypothetical protein